VWTVAVLSYVVIGAMLVPVAGGPVRTENSDGFENAEVTIIREMMVASTMNSVLVALFALFPSSFRSLAALQAEILALRHQLAVLHKNASPAPATLRPMVVGPAVTLLVGLAPLPADRAALDRRPLAPESLYLVLEQEIGSAPGKTRGGGGDSRSHTAHEPN
jgi:hypothetical protein